MSRSRMSRSRSPPVPSTRRRAVPGTFPCRTVPSGTRRRGESFRIDTPLVRLPLPSRVRRGAMVRPVRVDVSGHTRGLTVSTVGGHPQIP
ncbi:hypothetical protein SCWH03_04130 [Streptomyces pacificus]|uniref:Uncharacterized protein n=1 Tax=Streptomyces pacificus TaxID=2705029 RepID=A0A6A0APJ1_9ACTN|nr:hypothetical protein SCWH03_04130 [Streptomyces pacificus]